MIEWVSSGAHAEATAATRQLALLRVLWNHVSPSDTAAAKPLSKSQMAVLLAHAASASHALGTCLSGEVWSADVESTVVALLRDVSPQFASRVVEAVCSCPSGRGAMQSNAELR
jgi:cytochrome b561